MNDNLAVRAELERKVFAKLQFLIEQLDKGFITALQVHSAAEALYDASSGLVSPEINDAVHELWKATKPAYEGARRVFLSRKSVLPLIMTVYTQPDLRERICVFDPDSGKEVERANYSIEGDSSKRSVPGTDMFIEI